jgi:hypothetical protein
MGWAGCGPKVVSSGQLIYVCTNHAVVKVHPATPIKLANSAALRFNREPNLPLDLVASELHCVLCTATMSALLPLARVCGSFTPTPEDKRATEGQLSGRGVGSVALFEPELLHPGVRPPPPLARLLKPINACPRARRLCMAVNTHTLPEDYQSMSLSTINNRRRPIPVKFTGEQKGYLCQCAQFWKDELVRSIEQMASPKYGGLMQQACVCACVRAYVRACVRIWRNEDDALDC